MGFLCHKPHVDGPIALQQLAPGYRYRALGKVQFPVLPREASSDRAVMAVAQRPSTIAQLDELFDKADINQSTGRATLSWMLKYGLLQVLKDRVGSGPDCPQE